MAFPPVLKHLTTVADPTRCRVLRLLEQHELSVSELCSVLQLPQSTVSRHLKTLADDRWVTSRPDGTSRFYGMAPAELGAPHALGPVAGVGTPARQLWKIIREQVGESPAARQDDGRLAEVVEERRNRSREFFASTAGRWDHLRDELFGQRFHLQALPALLDERWTVGDLGCGTGLLAQALAPFVGRVVAVDGSAEMLETARARLCGADNVEFRQGELEALPIQRGELDAALLVLVLHYAADPGRILCDTARALRPGGRLLIVDMLPHEHTEYQQQMGHVWLGFGLEHIARLLKTAGFECPRVHPIPPAPSAKGPGLFVCAAIRS